MTKCSIPTPRTRAPLPRFGRDNSSSHEAMGTWIRWHVACGLSSEPYHPPRLSHSRPKTACHRFPFFLCLMANRRSFDRFWLSSSSSKALRTCRLLTPPVVPFSVTASPTKLSHLTHSSIPGGGGHSHHRSYLLLRNPSL